SAESIARAMRERSVAWDCAELSRLPTLPLLPTAPAPVMAALRDAPTIGDFFPTSDGIWTGYNERAVRFFWELDATDPRYVPLSGGKGYRRWFGSERLRVPRALLSGPGAQARVAGSWEYARVAGGKLSARAATPGSVAMAGVVSLRPKEQLSRPEA